MVLKVLLVAAALFVSVSANAAQPEAVPGEFIVKLKPSTAASVFSNQRSALGMMSARLGVSVKNVVSRPLGLVLVKVQKGAEVKASILSNHPDVEYVEPNYIYRINGSQGSPNDPHYGELWGLKNTGQTIMAEDGQPGLEGIEGIDVSAEAAWQITTGSKNVVVAVIDTGVAWNHPDLADNMWVNRAEKNGRPGVDDDGNGYVDDIYGYNFSGKIGDPMDDHGHGTHVSGTIGAKGNNGVDVVGVSWNVRIMALKFLTATGSGTLEDAIKAIDYATDNGAQIMSNSWGGGGYSKALEDAIVRSAKKNILFVAAAGNSSGNNDLNPTYPASYPTDNILAVAAIDNTGRLADFSCFGKTTVDVGAPGVGILSITPAGLKTWNGTSMATPHVSGVAVLLKSENPGMSALALKERIMKTSRPLASLKGKVSAGGLVNAYNALTNTIPPPDMNDPSNWPAFNYSLSTAHPYGVDESKTYTVQYRGAKKLAVHFSKFDFEAGYDYVKFYDKNGVEVGTFSGVRDDSFSPTVEGDTLTIVYTSDKTVTRYGFDIDKVAVYTGRRR